MQCGIILDQNWGATPPRTVSDRAYADQ